jgi:chromatin remodeling complex protein RSC6|tara:strand:+ start:8689 stop:9297 length:609 start_codon:yes stop_codon:yes gene_type:complete
MSKSTATKTTTTKASKAKPVSKQEPEPVAVEAPVTTEVVESSPPTTGKEIEETKEAPNPVSVYISKLNNYVDRINTMNKELKELVNVGKTLEKDFGVIVKVLSKKNKFKQNENRPLSGFAMPSLLSDELYEFLKIEKGTKVPRKDVTRKINEYIKENELRDEADKRNIRPNKELHKIFKSDDSNKITYFNLQSYLKHHFVKV